MELKLASGTALGKGCDAKVVPRGAAAVKGKIKGKSSKQVRALSKHAPEDNDFIPLVGLPVDNPEAWARISELFGEFKHIFKDLDEELTCTSRVKHRIITENLPSIVKRPYKVPFTKREVLNKETEKMLENGIIKESQSPWSSPVVLVEKKRHPCEEPELRVCIDYRGLNAITKVDFFPLPHLQDTLDQLSGAIMFSTMDLASGYFQVELDPRDKVKSAFSIPIGHYEFNRMGFG